MLFLRTFLLVALAAALPAPAKSPNVVILLADDLGWADVGYHESQIQTPNLDRLAKDGTQLDRYYSFPVCSPTRSALMTGRSPMRLGIAYTVVRPWFDYGLPLTESTMADSFHAAGYETAITGKWHLGHARRAFFPGARGFDHSYGHFNGAIDYYTHIRDGGLDWHRNGKPLKEEGYSTDLIASEAIRLIRSRDKSKPLFLYVPFNAPHSPLQAPEALIRKYASISDDKRRTFAAMTEAMDAAVGRILGTLELQGMTRDTLVLFFSDNGGPTNFGARNTPLRGAKASTWEGGTRVPAILRWPGVIAAGAKSSQVMAVWDVFPTFAAAAGVKPRNRQPFDGRNLWPQLKSGKTVAREDLFFVVEAGDQTFFAVHHHAKDGVQWKLVREISPRGVTDHLYRIAEDPNEANDLAAAQPALTRELGARIETWKTQHPAGGLRFSGSSPKGWKAPAEWAGVAAP
jgi:arylsulfatase A-like enzyme